MNQLITFNQSKAGKVPLQCEKNVRMGYGLASKYDSAWENWVVTDQHTGAPPPGVDTPVFFSYLSVTDGHVGVSLADGRFWSDGNIYASIAAYEANHAPKYVGWSTSLEGIQVIGGTMDKITKEQEQTCAQMQTGSNPGVNYNYQFTGQQLTQANLDKMLQFWSSQARPANPGYVKVTDLYYKVS